jgi:hypothetical protein
MRRRQAEVPKPEPSPCCPKSGRMRRAVTYAMSQRHPVGAHIICAVFDLSVASAYAVRSMVRRLKAGRKTSNDI